jgi:hypothetical protein
VYKIIAAFFHLVLVIVQITGGRLRKTIAANRASGDFEFSAATPRRLLKWGIN